MTNANTTRTKEWIRISASENPDKTAILYKNSAISYKKLDELVSKAAGELAKAGVKSGDTVAIWMENCPEFIIAFFSIIQLDAIAFPISVKEPEEQVRARLMESKAGFVVYKQEEHFQTLAKEKTFVKAAFKITNLSDISTRRLNNPEEEAVKSNLSGQVMRMYSSGSTEKPKHIIWGDSNIINSAKTLEKVPLKREDVFSGTSPFHHSYGLVKLILFPMKLGATTVIAENYFPHTVLDLIEKNKVTVFYTTPFMLGILADAYEEKPRKLKSMKYCFCTGALLKPETAMKFEEKYGVEVLRSYGSTETGLISTSMPGERGSSVGTPIEGMEIKVFNDNYVECRRLEIGRVGVKGPAVITEYANQPEQTKKAFKNGFLFLGDRGFIDENGNLNLVGREDVINLGGLKVDIAEVKNVLLSNPAVKEAAVYLKGREEGRLTAAVVAAEKISAEDLRRYCGKKLADYKIPKKIFFTDKLPRNEMGKIERRQLQNIGDE